MIHTHTYIYIHIIYLFIYLSIYLFHPLAITSQWQRPSWGFMAFHRTFWLAEGPLQKGAPWEKPLHDKLSIFRSYDVLWADSCIQLLDCTVGVLNPCSMFLCKQDRPKKCCKCLASAFYG